MASCCHDCHFRYEERYALPYLPAKHREQILLEHRALKAAGFPPGAMRAHARREVAIYKKFVPASIVAHIREEHAQMGVDDSAPTPEVAAAMAALAGLALLR